MLANWEVAALLTPLGQSAIGDGALGFWGALREARHPGAAVLVHKIANVLAALPKSAHPEAKKVLAEIWNTEGYVADRSPFE